MELSGDAYRGGLCAGTVELTTCICLGFACAVLFPYYLKNRVFKNRVFTIPAFLEMRYNRTARVFFSALMLVICVMTKMAFHLYAGGLVLHGLLGWNVMAVVALAGLVIAVFTMIGGFTAVAYTDSLQSCHHDPRLRAHVVDRPVPCRGMAGSYPRCPGSDELSQTVQRPELSFLGNRYRRALKRYVLLGHGPSQRSTGAGCAHARWGSMFAIFLKLSPVFVFALPGVIAHVLFPGREAKTTFVTLLNELLLSGARGIVLAALTASLISSNLSVMNSVSTLVVRDFIVHLRPRTSERAQVFFGRIAIAVAGMLGVMAAYLCYTTPDGLYKYLQAISMYLVMPITPAIAFGIMSKRVTVRGAIASVLAGSVLSVIFIVDQLIGPEAGAVRLLWLHTKLTANYTYRGIWSTLAVTAILFLVSALTPKLAPERLQHLTIDWSKWAQGWRGLVDWRLQLGVLSLATFFIYRWLW